MKKVVPLIVLGVCAVVLVSCDQRSQPGRGGPGSIADIAVFFAEGVTEQDLIEVSDLLSVPFINSSGQEDGTSLIEGLYGVDWDYVDYALYVRILPGTSERRVGEIIASLLSDARVDRVERVYLVPSHLD